MSLLKRLSITIFSRIDNAVAEIENHDALIKATLEEQAGKLMRAKGQLIQLRRKKEDLGNSLIKLKTDESSWQKRALIEANTDQERALKCLQRKKQVQQEMNQTEKNYHEYQLMEGKLERDIQKSEHELIQIKRKRELLSARQSSSDASTHLSRTKPTNNSELQEILSRWESNLDLKESLIAQQDEFSVKSCHSLSSYSHEDQF